MSRRLATVLALAALLGAVLGLWLAFGRPRRASGPLPQEAYVWQRSWGPEVREAVRRTEGLSRLVALAAEVDLAARPPRVAEAGIDAAALRAAGKPVGLAIRIGRFSNPGAERMLDPLDSDTVRFLAGLAGRIAARARAQGLPLQEIQLDYDCPESRLGAYPALVRAVQAAVKPLPVTVTALPAWLRHKKDFAALVQAADGYVLQVHSLAAPRRFDAAFLLCDPAAARQAVETAARFRKPFRVALPTYGYVVAFDRDGKVLGLSAEGPLLTWPRNAAVRVAHSDTDAMADLVRAWTADRPAALAGLLWYRLPSAADRLNWPLPAFRAVLAGRNPQPRLATALRTPAPGLLEIDLLSTGEADAAWPSPIEIRPAGPPPLAADALAGYRLTHEPDGRLLLRRNGSPWDRPLRPGERRQIAWLRFGPPPPSPPPRVLLPPTPSGRGAPPP